MNPSLQRWQSRHREAASHPPPEPAAFLVETFPLLPAPHPRSRALDFACGAGQNAVWLAERGWPVVAVDFAPAALHRAAALAAAHHIPVQRRSSLVEVTLDRHPLPGIVLVEADLETSALPEAAFDLILCFHYLHRAAFPAIERALAPRGFLLYETFTAGAHPSVRPPSLTTDDQRAFLDGPRSPDHLLARNELRSAFPHLQTLFYREWTAPQALASLLARKM
ncbi:MAG TPA: class I SAM-dependent methyltransferase [Candidatus Acidoferrales bacterium]|nr:class I SAM-dependent methyltransferase [Candidatus Acidoferrales bacterium]